MTEVNTRPQATLSQVIFQNTIFLTLGTIALKVLNFLFNVYVVRRLGDERFGQYSTVLAFVGLFQIFAELGLTQFVMREIAQDHSKADKLFWNLVVLRSLLAVSGIVGITFGAIVVGYSSQIVWGVFLVTCGFLFSAFDVPLETVLRANEKLGHIAGFNIIAQVVFVVFGAIFLLSGFSYISLIIASLIGIPLKSGLEFWTIRRYHLSRLKFQIEPRLWPHLIRSGIPFGVISLALAVAFSIDTVMLSMFEPDYVVGWYNVGYRLIFNLMVFISGFEKAIVPTLSRAYVDEPDIVKRWYYKTVKLILILSLPIAMGGMILAFPLIRLLYSDTFLPAAVGLQILIWDVPLLMFNSFCGNITTVVSEERAAARIYTLNAIANVLLNFYAIPRYGMIGAALVTVVTDFIGMLQFHFLLKNKLNLPNLRSTFGRVVFATILMGGLVYLVRNWYLILVIILGAIFYGGLVLALKIVDEKECALMRRGIDRIIKFRVTQMSRS